MIRLRQTIPIHPYNTAMQLWPKSTYIFHSNTLSGYTNTFVLYL